MLKDSEIFEIHIGKSLGADVHGDVVTVKYEAHHRRIREGVIEIDIPLNTILWSNFHVNDVAVSIDPARRGFKVCDDKPCTIRGQMMSDCEFRLTYRVYEEEKEMTVAEIEKALGHKVKIINK